MFDQLKMMKQAHDLQKKMKSLTVATEFSGIKIEVNGKFDILSLSLPDELMNDKANLENKLKIALNNAMAEAQKQTAASMRSEMGGLLGM